MNTPPIRWTTDSVLENNPAIERTARCEECWRWPNPSGGTRAESYEARKVARREGSSSGRQEADSWGDPQRFKAGRTGMLSDREVTFVKPCAPVVFQNPQVAISRRSKRPPAAIPAFRPRRPGEFTSEGWTDSIHDGTCAHTERCRSK
jgi:hypothetical protein